MRFHLISFHKAFLFCFLLFSFSIYASNIVKWIWKHQSVDWIFRKIMFALHPSVCKTLHRYMEIRMKFMKHVRSSMFKHFKVHQIDLKHFECVMVVACYEQINSQFAIQQSVNESSAENWKNIWTFNSLMSKRKQLLLLVTILLIWSCVWCAVHNCIFYDKMLQLYSHKCIFYHGLGSRTMNVILFFLVLTLVYSKLNIWILILIHVLIASIIIIYNIFQCNVILLIASIVNVFALRRYL